MTSPTRELRPGTWVRRQPDGVDKYVPRPPADGLVLYSEDHLPPVDASRPVDAFTACQLGLWAMLSAMRPRSFDLARWLQGEGERSRELEFQRIFFDWPRAEEDAVPTPSVTIMQGGEALYDQSVINPDNRLVEDSLGVYGEGTVLKLSSFLRVQVQLLVMTATKDDRAGVRRAFEDAFLIEPDDDRPGRRVIVPAYYGQTARYQLLGQTYQDDPETAQANQWILTAQLAAEIPVVSLVPAPAGMRPNLGAVVTGPAGT